MSHRMISAGICVLAMLTACSSTPPAGATPTAKASGGVTTAAPTNTPLAVVTPQATVAVVSQAPPPTGGSTGGDLADRFPAQIDGKPLANATVTSLLDYQRALGATDQEIGLVTSALAGIGIDAATVSIGVGTATLGTSPVSFFALQVPGHDAATLIPIRDIFSAVNEDDLLSQETSGGKSVTVVRSSGGFASSWMYVNGDILWMVNTSDPDEAAAIFTALP